MASLEFDVLPFSNFTLDSVTHKLGDKIAHDLFGETAEDIMSAQAAGVLDELRSKELIPDYEISEISDGAGIRFLQEEFTLIYPGEWTSYMHSLAGITCLEIVEILNRYCFTLIDAHAFNYVFHHGKPKLVDFGSIRKGNLINFPFTEFRDSFILPSRIDQKYSSNLSLLLRSQENSSDVEDFHFLLINRPLCRFFASVLPLKRIYKRLFRAKPLGGLNGNFVHNLLFSALLVFRKYLIRYYLRFLRKTSKFPSETIWSDYNRDFFLSDRFNFVLQKAVELNPKSFLDLGGNSGELAFAVASQLQSSERNLVLDFDQTSLNIGLSKTPSRNIVLDFALFNFSRPWVSANSKNYAERFQSDLVIALALTHHILLTDKLPLRVLMERLDLLTGRYLMIEFMPLGLYVSGSSVENLPKWYNQSNFEMELNRHFEILECINLEENRILYVCKK